jgi:hypothetical protein
MWRITVRNQPRAPSQSIAGYSGTIRHPSHSGELKMGGLQSRPAWGKARSYPQNNQAKRAGGVAQVVEYMHSKLKVLSSNPNPAPKKSILQRQKWRFVE